MLRTESGTGTINLNSYQSISALDRHCIKKLAKAINRMFWVELGMGPKASWILDKHLAAEPYSQPRKFCLEKHFINLRKIDAGSEECRPNKKSSTFLPHGDYGR